MIPLPTKSHELDPTPAEHFAEAAGFGFRSILLANEGDYVPQHVHPDTHATFVCSGSARMWIDGIHVGDKGAGEAFVAEAGRAHVFQALEPMTRLACVTYIADMMKGDL